MPRLLRRALLLWCALLASATRAAGDQIADWPATEGAPGGGRYSPLTDINRDNVARLKVAWTYRHGDYLRASWRPDFINRSTSFEATPIVVDGRLIFSTPFDRVIALDPETGAELWTFDPEIERDAFFANMMISRGVAYWHDGSAEEPCARRVFLGTLDARLIALDAATGRRCADFGRDGEVNLLDGLTGVVDPREYNVTSPPAVVGNAVIVGSSLADNVRRIQPPGDVRAFDARSGMLLWTFHTIPHPGEIGHETWENESWIQSGGANVWTTITADIERGWVFLPVSSASDDFYGGDRPGSNLFSDALVAVDAASGEYRWHFQTVHHDIWDYDLPAPPILATIKRGAGESPAVLQLTKTGFLFVLERTTGAPLLPVEERRVPPSDVPGEHAWSTQPFPLRPPPLTSQVLHEEDLWDVDRDRLEVCRKWLRELRNEGMFTPPSLRGSIVHPSNGGGANWSGASFDPQRGRLFVPVNNIAHVVKLKPVWGMESNFDNLLDRPLSSYLRGAWFLLTGRGTGLRYITHPITGRVLFAHDGTPCNRPPWGELVAVDMPTGEIAWRVPTGSKDGVDGLFGYGPPLATASGLVFHSGTADERLRVHDADTGKIMTTLDLPAGLHAGPITYKLRPEGKQYLVIAPGGHVNLGTRLGDYVIAYTLPD